MFILLLPLLLFVSASATVLPQRTAFQFAEPGTWLENIAVRQNGDLLLTMLAPTASLYTLKRPYSPTPELALLHTFEAETGLLGITETAADIFAVVSVTATPPAAAIWEFSFPRGCKNGEDLNLRQAVNLTNVQLPNGITAIPGSSAVLLADSFAGDIIQCDLQTGACEVVLKTAETAPVASIGVNGVRYRGGYVYWSNSDLVSLFRAPLGGQGLVETVGRVDAVFVDDFAEDQAGVFWVATGPGDAVVALRRDGVSEVVAERDVANSTAVAFGRTAWDSRTLYVVTHGDVEPAKVVALDTSGYHAS